MAELSKKTVERLSVYHRELLELENEGAEHIFSHQLAKRAGVSPVQLRHDIMGIGYSGSPARGYEVSEMLKSIAKQLQSTKQQNVAIVGIGNLGRAIMAYFHGRRENLRIIAGFDTDPQKTNRTISGCYCYAMNDIERICKYHKIRTAIIAVPEKEAQDIAEKLVQVGVRGIMNFAPVRLVLPDSIYVENLDMALTLEKVAYFARQ